MHLTIAKERKKYNNQFSKFDHFKYSKARRTDSFTNLGHITVIISRGELSRPHRNRSSLLRHERDGGGQALVLSEQEIDEILIDLSVEEASRHLNGSVPLGARGGSYLK